MALEHCIAPFLNKCDADDDHMITLKEWGKCLELDEVKFDHKFSNNCLLLTANNYLLLRMTWSRGVKR